MSTLTTNTALNITRQGLYGLLLMALLTGSCKKFISIPPPDNMVTQENVFVDDLTATAVLTNLYAIQGGFATRVAKFTGLSGDDFVLWPDADIGHQAYYTNQLQATQVANYGKEFWNECYPSIFICNSAIEGLNAAPTLTPSVKRQLLGEAYFMRAFFYHYLVSLYGELPLATGTNPEVNRQLFRRPVNEVYNFIISDLMEAQRMLSKQYLNGALKPYSSTPDRIRPTYWGATALLARVYCYNGEYQKAEAAATEIINYPDLFGLSPLSDVFLKNNLEAIWQLQPVYVGWNTLDARLFNLQAEPAGLSYDKPVHLSPFLLEAFESGDQRAVPGNWIDNIIHINTNTGNPDTLWFPNKYKAATADPNISMPSDMTEYCMVLRLAEQYLIRAEVRARQNNIAGARADLDVIRNRAGLEGTSAADQSSLLTAIFRERRTELFSEWAHRWLDLRRSGTINNVMPAVTVFKGGIWEPNDQLYPIPYEDILYNPRLIQNTGY